MKYLKVYYLFIILPFIATRSLGQDRIYNKENKINDCEVTEITPAFIKAVSSKNYYSFNPEQVLFVFNHSGKFLVIPRLYDDPAKAELSIKNFFSKENILNGNDQIITTKNEVLSCTLVNENEKGIEYVYKGKNTVLSKSDVAVIIYKDGRHKLFSNTGRSLKVLSAVQDKYNDIAFTTTKSEYVKPQAYVKNVAFVSPAADDTKDQKQLGEDSQLNKIVSAPLEKKKSSKPNMQLDSVTLVSLQGKAVMNIKELETYLKIISDKDLDAGQVNTAIGQALSLFTSEDAIIEVSSKNRTKIQFYNVKAYLNRLGFMKYSKVMIEWYNVQYVSKIRLNPDNTYSGIIEVQQKFTGMSGDRKIYEDITRKTVEIVLKSYNVKKGGENVREWDVFLGNIGISVNDPQ